MVSKAPLSDDPIINYDLMHQELAYLMMCYWGPRAETPESLAPRFQRTLEGLSRISPAFGDWQVRFNERMILLGFAGLNFADIVQSIVEGVAREDDEVTPDPTCGYFFGASTGLRPDRRNFTLSIQAGSAITTPRLPFPNTVELKSYPLCAENASLLTLDVLKPALLILITEWQPIWCGLAPGGVADLQYERFRTHKGIFFGLQWVTYLSPRFAPMVTPPASAVTEYLPDGGLLMIATEERFDVDNPRHLAVARDIEDALAPVNALPWPPDAEPAR